MNKLFPFILLIFGTSVFGNTFPIVEHKVNTYPKFRSAEHLGYRIMNDFNSDSLRVRAAFLWITRNMKYGKRDDSLFIEPPLYTYATENEKEMQIEKLVSAKLDAFIKAGEGVCVDYSLLLNSLCRQFGLPSKVILGKVKSNQSKDGKIVLKNHTWNAVRINGYWRLMDPTWASGNKALEENKLTNLYFFSDPAQLIKSHLPMNDEWQLMASPVNTEAFVKGPIYFRDFFSKDMALSSKTEASFRYGKKEVNQIYFDKLPESRIMYYTIGNSDEFQKLGLKKERDQTYIARVRIPKKRMVSGDTVTLYKDDDPIAYFKIKD